MALKSEPQKSGMRVALEFTGIPVSWLSKRPKLPSRNWLIFIGVTSSVASYYIYDRRECRRIKGEFIERVRHYGEELAADHQSLPRKITVYAARWPGDQDYEAGIKYFKKYVKPILVAAAVDFDIVNGKRHGDIARRVEAEVKARRRVDAGLDPYPYPAGLPPNHPHFSQEERRERELEGGVVLIGRPTFKEYMAGLVNGWQGSLERVDHEEILAQQLELDGRFDEVDEEAPKPDFSNHVPGSPLFSPILTSPSSTPPPLDPVPAELDVSPAQWPPLPPFLMVTFVDLIGFKQMPLMLWEWFNTRNKVRQGAQDAYRLIMNQTRPIHPEEDLAFDQHQETYYRSALSIFMEDIDNARKKYYDQLAEKLKLARDLARGVREPTQLEMDKPPKSEVELRSERMTKEQRWRGDVQGFEIIRTDNPVAWDSRLEGSMKVFVDPENKS